MLKILFNTVLGLILIFIWSRFVDLNEIMATLSKINPVYLLPVLLFMILSPFFRAVRLKIFLSEIKKIKLLDMFFLNGAAMMLNFFIPVRAGEFLKGFYLNTNYSLPLGKSVIWIFIDRFVDFLGVLFFAATLFFIVPTALDAKFISILSILLASALAMTYLVVYQPALARKFFNFLRYFLIVKRFKIYFDRFTGFILETFSILKRHPKDLALMMILTVLGYAADAAIWYFTFLSLGVNLGFLKMYLGQTLSALTYLIPAAPGYVGSAEASGLLILSGIFGINANLASAMIVLFHVLSALFVLIFGLISIYSLKINLSSVWKKVFRKG